MDRAQQLRERLVSHLHQVKALHDPRVAAAFLAVPRHRFVPEQFAELAYDDRALALKEHDGLVLSSISQPGMIAQMLEMLQVAPGAHILEIGTGSGYNAALLSTLVGEHGRIVSIEIETDLAEGARSLLQELGYRNVEVRSGDAESIVFANAFERIIVTARARDIANAWWSTLKDGGRIVIPLDISYGGERVVAFIRDGSRLRSIATQACSFIGMRNGDDKSSGDIFFRSSSARYLPEPDARTPLSIVAMRRDDVRPDFLESADVVVARRDTFFAITIGL